MLTHPTIDKLHWTWRFIVLGTLTTRAADVYLRFGRSTVQSGARFAHWSLLPWPIELTRTAVWLPPLWLIVYAWALCQP